MRGGILGRSAGAVLASVLMLLATDGAFGEPTKSRNEIYARTVPFQSADKLDEFSVSGVWVPQEQVPYAGLSGPAIFVFKSASAGTQWTVAVNAIALLDKEFWDRHGVADAAQLEPEALVKKLTEFDVVSISLSQTNRAKIISCRPAESAPPGKAGGDRCLQLGNAVVDLQDIDFDGRKELVFRHAGIGQRSGDTYEVVRIDPNADVPVADSREPFRDIDWRTVINITRRQIILEGSNGACDSTEATYSRDASGGMSMTHFWRSVTNAANDCSYEDYAVESQVDGVGRRLKLSSPRKSGGSAIAR